MQLFQARMLSLGKAWSWERAWHGHKMEVQESRAPEKWRKPGWRAWRKVQSRWAVPVCSRAALLKA